MEISCQTPYVFMQTPRVLKTSNNIKSPDISDLPGMGGGGGGGGPVYIDRCITARCLLKF